MFAILANRIYRRLFTAQIVALLGTGLLTVALGLLAFDIAGQNAGQVLGLALAIKMVAYVGLSPVMAALVARLNRRSVLIAADLVRATAAVCLPFIDAVWQIYALIFVLQAASATFTPTFQAVIPDILPDVGEYTRALSLARLAYDLENLLSPLLAGLMLLVIAPSGLFVGTAAGFLASAALVYSIKLPPSLAVADRPFRERLTMGTRIYLATPRLRGLLALNMNVAVISAVVLVLTVVIARGIYGGSEPELAVALGAYGAGSMATALILPRLLDRVRDRPVMIASSAVSAVLMLFVGGYVNLWGWPSWLLFIGLWFSIGAALAGVTTPSGRLLRRSAHPDTRPAVFAAQFALSHACWLLGYPLAGFLGSAAGVETAMLAAAGIAVLSTGLAIWLWPARTEPAIEHSHDDLPPGHPHLEGAVRKGDVWVHRHVFVIDDEHRVWPTSG